MRAATVDFVRDQMACLLVGITKDVETGIAYPWRGAGLGSSKMGMEGNLASHSLKILRCRSHIYGNKVLSLSKLHIRKPDQIS